MAKNPMLVTWKEQNVLTKYRPLLACNGLQKFIMEVYKELKTPVTPSMFLILKRARDLSSEDLVPPMHFPISTKDRDKAIKVLRKGGLLDKDEFKLTTKAKDMFKKAHTSRRAKKWAQPLNVLDWTYIANLRIAQRGTGGSLTVIRGKQGSGKTTTARKMVESMNRAGNSAIYLDIDMFLTDQTGDYRRLRLNPLSSYIRETSGVSAYHGFLSLYLVLGYNVVISNIYRKRSSLNRTINIAKATGCSFSLIHATTPHTEVDSVMARVNAHGVSMRTYDKYRIEGGDKEWEYFDDFQL